jgi:hypothetical protein
MRGRKWIHALDRILSDSQIDAVLATMPPSRIARSTEYPERIQMQNLQVMLRLMVLALPLAGCAQQNAPSQPPLQPVASVQDIMESLIGHMATDVFNSVGTIIDEKGTQEIVPENDEAWAEVRYAAMGLAETGNLLMFEGRAKDTGDWQLFSQQLIERSVAAAKAAEAKNPEQLLDAGGQLYEVCLNCHQKYIPSDPQ